MSAFLAVFRRELFQFFLTPLAWVLGTVFLLLQGMHFYLLVDHFSKQPAFDGETPVHAFFGKTVVLYLILFLILPAMTMRSFSEERRSGTAELLLTSPLSPTGLVLAKYAATLLLYVAMWAPTTLYLLLLGRSGPLDWGVAGASYLGVFLLGAMHLAIGQLMSSLAKSQFVAFLSTAMIVLGQFVLGLAEIDAVRGSLTHRLATSVSVWVHMDDFASGIVDSRHLVFDLSFAILALFLTVRSVETWREG